MAGPQEDQEKNKSKFGILSGVLIFLAGVAGIATALALTPFSGGLSLFGVGIGFNVLMIAVSSLIAAVGLGVASSNGKSNDVDLEFDGSSGQGRDNATTQAVATPAKAATQAKPKIIAPNIARQAGVAAVMPSPPKPKAHDRAGMGDGPSGSPIAATAAGIGGHTVLSR